MKELICKLWHKYATREMLFYILFGTGTTIVNYIAYYLFMHAPFINELGEAVMQARLFTERFPNMTVTRLTPLLVNILAWIIAVIYAFLTNKTIVFRSFSFRPAVFWPEFGKFILARLLSLGFEELFLLVTVTFFAMNNYLAKILAAVFVVIMNYFASKLLIFKPKAEDEQNVVESESVKEDL